MSSVLEFLREARVELARVNWPTREQIIHFTILVIAISIVLALFLGGLDFLFSFLVERFLIK
jgi:preprotein translocase subunit SecE